MDDQQNQLSHFFLSFTVNSLVVRAVSLRCFWSGPMSNSNCRAVLNL